MRIGLIAPPWTPVPPTLYGGTELVVDHLATGFQKAGHDVVLFTTGDSTCPVPRRHLLPKSEGHRIGTIVPELIHVHAAYDTLQDCDIVHDHTLLGPQLHARHGNRHGNGHGKGGPTVVTTIHGPLDDELAGVYRPIAEHVPLIAISHAQRRPVPQLPIARVIHHGIDAGDFPFGDGSGGYFVFLGRMSPDKGAHRAMAAAYKAGVKLVMAAKMREPAEREYFERFVQPYLNDDLVYLGEIPHQEKVDLLAGATGLLFPIRWNEPFGMVMIEAMACGTPVLAFPEGAAPEVVEDGRTGFLCHDESDMAEAITRAHTLDRSACRAAVEGYFSNDRMVAEHLALFEQLVGRP